MSFSQISSWATCSLILALLVPLDAFVFGVAGLPSHLRLRGGSGGIAARLVCMASMSDRINAKLAEVRRPHPVHQLHALPALFCIFPPSYAPRNEPDSSSSAPFFVAVFLDRDSGIFLLPSWRSIQDGAVSVVNHTDSHPRPPSVALDTIAVESYTPDRHRRQSQARRCVSPA